MIIRLEEGKKYKLIDKDGWYGDPLSKTLNESIHGKCFNIDDVVLVTLVDEKGWGYASGSANAVISSAEYKFFELYEEPDEEEPQPYWDGKSPLEVGMIVDIGDTQDTILAVSGKDVCVGVDGELELVEKVLCKRPLQLTDEQELSILKLLDDLVDAEFSERAKIHLVRDFAEAWKGV